MGMGRVVGSMLGPGRVYPLDVFTYIFVFNQSGRPRRLEVTCPGERRRGKGRQEEEEEYDGRRIGEEDGVSWGFGYG
jgi:hypothetical protein